MKFNRNISIDGKTISDNSSVYIIAEAGVNHNGDMDIAKKLIDVAAESDADAVKFQTFKTENLILAEVEKAPYQKKTTQSEESQFEMLKRLEVTKQQNLDLIQYCKDKGITFLSTPFDEDSLEELIDIGIPAIKVASTDTTNLPFLKKIAQSGKPIILSTGMSYLTEVELALKEIHLHNKDVVILQCTANYPIDDSEANLNVIETFKEYFDMLIGYSDHSVGLGAAPYAIPMGAKVVEKHFTLSHKDDGPDHRASLSPGQLKYFVQEVRKVEKYLGVKEKKPTLSEMKTRTSLQKCLVAMKEIKQGEQLTFDNIRAKRTGGRGISPIYYRELLIKKASRNYCINDIIDE